MLGSVGGRVVVHVIVVRRGTARVAAHELKNLVDSYIAKMAGCSRRWMCRGRGRGMELYRGPCPGCADGGLASGDGADGGVG